MRVLMVCLGNICRSPTAEAAVAAPPLPTSFGTITSRVGLHGGDLAGLGVAPAFVHAADVGDTFGWHRDNLLGTVEQVNAPMTSQPAFLVDCRIQPHLPHLPADLARRLEQACAGPLPSLLDHDVRPSLVHGDLGPGFLDGYRRVAPLDPGWQDRQPILQLPHLLVHVRMFGGSWLGAVSARLDAHGW